MRVRHVTRQWGRGDRGKTRVRITCLRVSFCVQVGMRLGVQIRICAYSQKLSAAIRNVNRKLSRSRVRCCRAATSRYFCCCCCCCCLRLLSVSICTFVLAKQVISAPLRRVAAPRAAEALDFASAA